MINPESLSIVQTQYPAAAPTAHTFTQILGVIKDELGLQPSQLMLADSICADDVNAMQYPKEALDMLGPFKMGGLNGFPFTGLTGMGAFAHHVPEDGALLIYYGPHIGVGKSGTAGEILRIGQSQPSACCGAAKAALKKLTDGQIEAGASSDLDFQQNTIEQIFYRQKDRILAAEDGIKEATNVMYEAIDERIHVLVEKTKYPSRYLILVGVIVINGDPEMGSSNDVRRFDIIDLNSGETRSVLPALEAPLS